MSNGNTKPIGNLVNKTLCIVMVYDRNRPIANPETDAVNIRIKASYTNILIIVHFLVPIALSTPISLACS